MNMVLKMRIRNRVRILRYYYQNLIRWTQMNNCKSPK